MAHPALIAYERFDRRYDLYRAPKGGYVIEFACRLESRPESDPVGPEPMAVALDFEGVLAMIDPLRDEAIYLVGDGVRAYRVLRFAVPTAEGVIESSAEPGMLVAPRDVADPEPDGYLRGWFEATREAVGELVDRGVLRDAEAVSELRDRVSLFASEDVEVIALPSGDE